MSARPARLLPEISSLDAIASSVTSALLALVAALTLSAPAVAHESRPIYVEITETEPQRYRLQWKTPPSIPLFYAPEIAFSAECEKQNPVAQINAADGLVRRQDYYCAHGLSGQNVAIRYPGPNPSVSTLLRYQTVAGERHTAVLSPEDTTWLVPRGETAASVIRVYTLLGIQHILAGIDHVLFLFCLLWIAGTWKRILVTITGFTVAHSITLILSALNWVRLPAAPVEAVIALSIVLLATEIARGRSRSLTWSYPIAVSSSFGLLHGFGFAAALRDIGLPQTELAAGLLFFNVGVEIGQIGLAAGFIVVMRLVQRLTADRMREAYWGTVGAYISGVAASYWLIERCVAFLPA